MVSYHVQSLPGDETFVRNEHAVHVLVVSPREFQFVQTAIGLVHAVIGIVPNVVHVWIQPIVPGQYHRIVGYATSHDECIPSQRPLFAVHSVIVGRAVSILTVVRVSPKEHDLTHVVYQADDLEPVRMIRLAYSLGGL